MGISSSHFSDCEVSVRGDKVKMCTVGPLVSPSCCIHKPAPTGLGQAGTCPLAQALAWTDLAMRSDGGNLHCVSQYGGGGWELRQEQRELRENRGKTIKEQAVP